MHSCAKTWNCDVRTLPISVTMSLLQFSWLIDPSSAIIRRQTWSVSCLIHVPLTSVERHTTDKWACICRWNVVICTFEYLSYLYPWTATVTRTLNGYVGPPLLFCNHSLKEIDSTSQIFLIYISELQKKRRHRK